MTCEEFNKILDSIGERFARFYRRLIVPVAIVALLWLVGGWATDWPDEKHVPEYGTTAYWRSVLDAGPIERFLDWRAYVAYEADKALCDRLPGRRSDGYAEAYSAQWSCLMKLSRTPRASRHQQREGVKRSLLQEARARQ